MASDEQNIFSTGIAPEVPAATAAPIKKAAAKRAPRKATKKASAPQQTPDGVPGVASGATPDASAATPDASAATPDASAATADASATPARKAAKRAPRKTAKKAVAAPATLDSQSSPAASVHVDPAPAASAHVDPAPAAPAPTERAPEPEAPPVQTFGLFFQPPAPTEAPRRRRATAPAAAPAPEQGETHQPQQFQQTSSADTSERGEGARHNGPQGSEEADDSGSEGTPRRRRRGGKGRRGRATGEGGVDESSSEQTTESNNEQNNAQNNAQNNEQQDGGETSSSGPSSSEDNESGEGGESRRRTRRRRRGSAGEGDDQQQGSTTTRVREPRPRRDEVTSVKGSTRLEAKKQRRREGREAGRRRTVITEAEFLARRESVERVMVVRHKQDRTQIGVLEDGVLVEHYVSRETNASMAGNVYLGRIQNVLPSMEAAFVDIGKGRNAVLYAGEVNWDAAGLDNRAKRIENALSSGQSVLVQVTKDPIGHKGARLTSQVSLPGRYLVYVPDGNMMGISRKLPDTERARLKKILREVVPENAGVIVRTAAEGASEDELRADVTRLTAAWNDIQAKSKSANAPALLHGEPDLTVRVIRDVFNEDFAKLVVSGDPAWDAVSGYVNNVAPDLADRIQKWTGEQDLFTHYRVDEQIAKAMDRKVWLPSGGTLVIDRTEAMTVVDVNTGKFVGSGGNLEETVTKNNIEAAEEVVRQLRLRDIGGIIVIDFIDMVLESNRDLVVRRLLECLGRDRTKHQVAEVTSLGLVQMTRKRVGAGLIEVFSEDCEHCNGRGIIVSADPIDRPAGDGSSGGGSGGGADKGDAGGGRGTRGRRARGTGRDTSVMVVPELPVPTGGPTPAQIAAAAHAAAIQVTLQTQPAQASGQDSPAGEVATPVEQKTEELQDAPAEVAAPKKSRRRSSRSAKSPAFSVDPAAAPMTEQPVVVESAAEPSSEPSSEPTDQPQDAPVAPAEVAAPQKSRRRSSRSAKSPAFSVDPAAAPMTVQPVAVEPAVELHSFEPPATYRAADAGNGAAPAPVAETPQVTQVAEVTAPPVRTRRKRPRVVAPAGPPPGAGQADGASGEFGS
jgi:ribonuclease E